jgi:hypothetical protein
MKGDQMKGQAKSTVRTVLIWLAAFGPATLLMADRLGHALGICIGAH